MTTRQRVIAATNRADKIKVGSRWREKDTGRVVEILEECVHDTGPAWTYIDADGKPEPDSPPHPDWFWHYCDVFDFVVWDRFQPLD